MHRLIEDDIERLAIEQLQGLGYTFLHGPDIAPDGNSPMRDSYNQALLPQLLSDQLRRINPSLPPTAIAQAVQVISRQHSPDLLTNNERMHRLLTDGVPVSFRKDGQEVHELCWLLHLDSKQNTFHVVNQFTIIENEVNKRPDLVLFVNGLPLVVIELKNAVNEQTTVRKAFDQLKTYQATIPSLFTFNAFNVISDGFGARAGSLSAGFSRYMAWKSVDGNKEASRMRPQLETLIAGMLPPERLLDLVKHFIVFEQEKTQDTDGVIRIQPIKKLAAYHQYFAVNKAVERTKQAAKPDGDRKGGVVWHTQGSGKSLSMVFFSGKLVQAMDNPTIVVITDRNDLDDQLFGTFAASKQLLRQEPVQAESREDLKRLLKVGSGGIVFTTIQKFLPDDVLDEDGKKVGRADAFDTLSDRTNIIVIADEAHRTQYGFGAKMIAERDADTKEVIGQRIAYGFAKYMRDALPKATYVGFTGTPIEAEDVNTPAVFGQYIDIYDIADAVEDGATVRIYYESRLAKVNMDEQGRRLLEEFDEHWDDEQMSQAQRAKRKWSQLEAIIGHPKRIKNVAADIVHHFEQRQEAFEGKAMIVAMSREIAVKLYEAIVALKPDWHHEDLDKGAIKVVMTANSSDGPAIAKHHTTKQQRTDLAIRMKHPDDPLKMVIVRDMWLTGFDVPSLHTMYIDKPMKGHTLMQAIARVNRVFKDKPGGLVVDYLGIASSLKEALSFYSDSGGKGDPTETQEKAVQLLKEKLEVVQQLFSEQSNAYKDIAAEEPAAYGSDERTFLYQRFFKADSRQKLRIILQAQEHVLGLDKGKERFLREVTALNKVFALAVPHEQAMRAKEEIAFFQAIRAHLVKFESGATSGSGSGADYESAIKQLMESAVHSEGVVDVFAAAGMKKPDISILSEDFLREVGGMKHKNLALELLKKILRDEIKVRSKTNMVKSKRLYEMVEQSLNKYNTQAVTAAEVIQELIEIAKRVREADKRGEELGLNTEELAFFEALEQNDSAVEVMGNEELCALAREITAKVKQNTTIDWTIRETARAKLLTIVKRTLRKYGYPPDLQKLATETVIRQAELMADGVGL